MTKNPEENSGSSSEAEDLKVKFIDPSAVIAQMDLKQGETIADFGCGTGYFSIPLAQKIGEEGKVYSLDVAGKAGSRREPGKNIGADQFDRSAG